MSVGSTPGNNKRSFKLLRSTKSAKALSRSTDELAYRPKSSTSSSLKRLFKRSTKRSKSSQELPDEEQVFLEPDHDVTAADGSSGGSSSILESSSTIIIPTGTSTPVVAAEEEKGYVLGSRGKERSVEKFLNKFKIPAIELTIPNHNKASSLSDEMIEVGTISSVTRLIIAPGLIPSLELYCLSLSLVI
eukprot:sb/3471197/